uniref:Uncharacterized protein n=1 Tax=Tanacetum cinerariifolium TaxID=118510 RepID=A0A699HAL2_TANCI|nr:hypothetical protein [Tanacetum cinerariifolium]
MIKDYKQAKKFCTKVRDNKVLSFAPSSPNPSTHKWVLEIKSKNVKTLYRMAQAFIDLVDLDHAKLDIKKALEIDLDNRKRIMSRCEAGVESVEGKDEGIQQQGC